MPDLLTPDGAAVVLDREEINREFARSMSAGPADGAPAPPPRDTAPPAADPPAPPKRGRGRPRNDEKPRATSAPVPAPGPVSKDYTRECEGLTTAGWAILAAVPYTTPYAAVVDANQDQLVAALNAGAQNNAKIRARVEALSSGAGGAWAIQLAAVTVNMGAQAMSIMRDPEIRLEARQSTEAKFREFLKASGAGTGEQDQAAAEAGDNATVAA